MKNKRTILLFILIGVLLFGFLGFKVYNDFFKDNSNAKKIDSLELYGYSLTKNDSELFKTEFEALRTTLNKEPINYEEYAKSISKLFIIDLYTINNKLGSTDIGGTEFIYPDLVLNFTENMGSSLYKNVETNIYGDRTQKLPEVSEVTVDSIEETTYAYKDVDYEGYSVKLTWNYVEDLGYQNTINLTLIKSNSKLFIVKAE